MPGTRQVLTPGGGQEVAWFILIFGKTNTIM